MQHFYFRSMLATILLFISLISSSQPTTPVTNVDPSGLVKLLWLDSTEVKTGSWWNKYLARKMYQYKFKNIIISDLDPADKKEKTATRQVIIEKINLSLTSLKTGKELSNFLELFYGIGTIADLRKDLNNLKTYLETDDNTTAPTLINNFVDLHPLIKKYLFAGGAKIYTSPAAVDVNGNTTIELWKSSAYNQLVIDYYNKSVPVTQLVELDLDRLLSFIEEMTKLNNEADSINTAFTLMDVRDTYSITFLDSVDYFHQTVVNSSAYKYLNQDKIRDWFFNWLWFRGGALRLNPLDFTTEIYLQKQPSYDKQKADIYNEYVKTKVQWMILHDTTVNLEKFTNLLKQYGKGEDIFSNTEQLKKLISDNKGQMEHLLKVKKLLNRIRIPSKGPIYSISAEKDFIAWNNNVNYLRRPLSEDEIKTIVVHNISQGYSVGLAEKVSENKDASTFEKNTDSLSSLLVLAASYYPQFNAYSTLFGSLGGAKAINPSPIPSTSSTSARFSSGPADVLAYIKLKMPSRLYKKEIVETVARANSLIALSDSYDPDDEEQKKWIESFFKAYYEYLNEKIKQAKLTLSGDMLNIRFLKDILQNSTLTPDKLKGQEDDNPLFYSSLVTTTPNSKSAEEVITPYVYKEKDTVKLSPFTYERGKHYRFQISAGLAYTASAISQSSVAKTNGSITITNTAQLYQFSIGFHVYFGRGLMLKDDRFLGRFKERSSIYAGIGIPQPLENFYLGYSYDLYPGLRTVVGARFYKKNQYEIQNNEIISERLKYKPAFPFFALQIDPAGLLKALNLFKTN